LTTGNQLLKSPSDTDANPCSGVRAQLHLPHRIQYYAVCHLLITVQGLIYLPPGY
jgi:hypothetical protein